MDNGVQLIQFSVLIQSLDFILRHDQRPAPERLAKIKGIYTKLPRYLQKTALAFLDVHPNGRIPFNTQIRPKGAQGIRLGSHRRRDQ